jgi:hypothetical protein
MQRNRIFLKANHATAIPPQFGTVPLCYESTRIEAAATFVDSRGFRKAMGIPAKWLVNLSHLPD